MAEWVGWEADAMDGAGIGRVSGFYLDADSGEPAWLIVSLARGGFSLRRRPERLVAVPLRDCAGAAGRCWIAHEREVLETAPTVDPERPLLRYHELAICSHFGIGEKVGRAAEIAGRAEDALTANPA